MGNENFSSVGAPEFPEFSSQITLGGMTGANEVTQNPEDSTPNRKKNQQPAWNTKQNSVLISGWIKYETSSVVGRNQKGETYWGRIAEYCNEHCSFDPPRDWVACQNRFNHMNKILVNGLALIMALSVCKKAVSRRMIFWQKRKNYTQMGRMFNLVQWPNDTLSVINHVMVVK